MTRTELLQAAKPILFNTEMVRAILDGRKTVTRRVIKQKVVADVLSSPARLAHPKLTDKQFVKCLCDAPYETDDVLWVRETWQKAYDTDGNDRIIEGTGQYIYAASPEAWPHFTHWVDNNTGEHKDNMPWRPSIHMPKEATRLFLRVTGVWVERLQDIMESPYGPNNQIVREGCMYGPGFIAVWENTIKPVDRPHYGWNANPWVWVIEFERVSSDERG